VCFHTLKKGSRSRGSLHPTGFFVLFVASWYIEAVQNSLDAKKSQSREVCFHILIPVPLEASIQLTPLVKRESHSDPWRSLGVFTSPWGILDQINYVLLDFPLHFAFAVCCLLFAFAVF
jgi:hypothetical protein